MEIDESIEQKSNVRALMSKEALLLKPSILFSLGYLPEQ